MSDWYNGYSPNERAAKGRQVKPARETGLLREYLGPCMLCGDPEAPTEPHSEDYSKPYRWEPPALFWLCRYCHRAQLHKRFADKTRWIAYLAHVRRGGYGREVQHGAIKREYERLRDAIGRGEAPLATLPVLRPRTVTAEGTYLEQLTTDSASRTSPSARPRP